MILQSPGVSHSGRQDDLLANGINTDELIQVTGLNALEMINFKHMLIIFKPERSLLLCLSEFALPAMEYEFTPMLDSRLDNAISAKTVLK